MISISKIIAFLKFRLDQGSVFLTVANFIMLLMMISEKALAFFNIKMAHGELIFTIVFIVVGFLLMLLAGQFLIKIRYIENYSNEQNYRNPMLQEISKDVKDIKERINK